MSAKDRFAELDSAIRGIGEETEPPRRRKPAAPISERVEAVEATAKRALEEFQRAGREGRVAALLDPEQIVDSVYRDRDEAAFRDEEFQRLVRSIQEQGQITPIAVRPIKGQQNRFEIVYGHRRVRACRALGILVKGVILGLDDRQLVAAMLVENAVRADLSAIEKARHLRRLADEELFTRETLAGLLRVSKTQISNLILLAEIPDPVLDLLGDWRGLSINTGRLLVAALRASDGVPEEVIERVRALPPEANRRAKALIRSLAPSEAPDERGRPIRDAEGRRYGLMTRAGKQVVIRFRPELDAEVLELLAERLPTLYQELCAEREDG